MYEYSATLQNYDGRTTVEVSKFINSSIWLAGLSISCVCQVLQKPSHLDRAEVLSSRRSRPSLCFFSPERSAACKGAPGFGAAQRTLAREHRSGISQSGDGRFRRDDYLILLVSSEWVLVAHAALLICSFFCSLRYSIFRYRVASIQFSCISTASARTSRRQAAELGKIRTTSVRLLISSFNRSNRLVDFKFL